MFSLIDVNETPRLPRHSQALYETEAERERERDRHRERQGHRETDGTAVLLNLDRKVMKLDL